MFVFIAGISSYVGAQSKSILEELARPNEAGAVVTINSDSKINALIGKGNFFDPAAENELLVKGYRIQIYSGNQRQSRDEANAKAKEFKEYFPNTATYVKYTAPIWRLRVGDFQTNEEAVFFMQEMKKKLPSLGSEMYIVSDEVKVITE